MDGDSVLTTGCLSVVNRAMFTKALTQDLGAANDQILDLIIHLHTTAFSDIVAMMDRVSSVRGRLIARIMVELDAAFRRGVGHERRRDSRSACRDTPLAANFAQLRRSPQSVSSR